MISLYLCIFFRRR